MTKIAIPEYFKNRPYTIEHFSKIVQWASTEHPFYQKHIPHPEKEVPILKRQTIQDDNDLLLNGHKVSGRTSGSTGMPVRIAWTNMRANIEQNEAQEFATWMGGRLTRAEFTSLTTHEKADNIMEINTPPEEQVAFIQERRRIDNIECVKTYPSSLEILCKHIIANKIDMPFIKRVMCMSEVYEDYHDELIKQAFPNARPFSNYSATEVGIIAFRCPHNPDFHHIMGKKLGVEFLNDNDEPCQEGELGRIIVTDYFNKAASIIRYDIGDLAIPARCDCGIIPTPAMQKIVGKIRGTLLHKDGHKIIFTDLSVAIRDTEGVKQYQVVQDTLDDFVVRYAANDNADTTKIEASISKAFEKQFAYLPNIRFTREEAIERGNNGKFYASICKIS